MALQISASRELNTAISFSALSFYKSTDQKPFAFSDGPRNNIGVNGLTIASYVYDVTQE